jgi:hypothetical protein
MIAKLLIFMNLVSAVCAFVAAIYCWRASVKPSEIVIVAGEFTSDSSRYVKKSKSSQSYTDLHEFLFSQSAFNGRGAFFAALAAAFQTAVILIGFIP